MGCPINKNIIKGEGLQRRYIYFCIDSALGFGK